MMSEEERERLIRSAALGAIIRVADREKFPQHSVQVTLERDAATGDLTVAYRLAGKLAMQALGSEEGARIGLRIQAAIRDEWYDSEEVAKVKHLLTGDAWRAYLQAQVDKELAERGTRSMSDESFADVMRAKRMARGEKT